MAHRSAKARLAWQTRIGRAGESTAKDRVAVELRSASLPAVLADLRAAIAAADWVRALELALEAWRGRRASGLADLVERIGARCARYATPQTRVHARWMTRAFSYEPAAVTQLLAELALEAEPVDWEPMRMRWLLRRGKP